LPLDLFEVLLEYGNEKYPVLDTDTEEGDEAYSCRNAEIGSREMEGGNTPNDGKGHVQEYQPCIFEIAEHNK